LLAHRRGETKQWSDYTSSDPINDIEAGKSQILSTTGQEANTLVLGYETFRQLKNHPDLVDRIKYTSSQTITTDMLAAMFDIPRVMVAKAVKATNKEGATGAYGFAYGKGALLCHVAQTRAFLLLLLVIHLTGQAFQAVLVQTSELHHSVWSH
jgi:hypothetical protein